MTTIEICFRSDYDPDLKKVAEKQLQHAPTCEALGRHYNLDNLDNMGHWTHWDDAQALGEPKPPVSGLLTSTNC
jgi:hypothetical protein